MFYLVYTPACPHAPAQIYNEQCESYMTQPKFEESKLMDSLYNIFVCDIKPLKCIGLMPGELV